jgi:lipoyl synthase
MAQRKPAWLKVKIPTVGAYSETAKRLRGLKLNTVCREAHCPNICECWEAGTATMMILGDHCTRACKFCAVMTSGAPAPVDLGEPKRVAAGIARLGLAYAVITSVTRDDLPDGGASAFAQTVHEIRRANPGTGIELLIPDFAGNLSSLDVVAKSAPDVVGHNLETVQRLSGIVRDPRTSYQRSLDVLAYLAGLGVKTKSSMMLGMGERIAEVLEAMRHLRKAGVSQLSLGQYLAPGPGFHEVADYVTPEMFDEYKMKALDLGFESVMSGPLVRSSYNAGQCLSDREQA